MAIAMNWSHLRNGSVGLGGPNNVDGAGVEGVAPVPSVPDVVQLVNRVIESRVASIEPLECTSCPFPG
jgi:hypothetical protein